MLGWTTIYPRLKFVIESVYIMSAVLELELGGTITSDYFFNSKISWVSPPIMSNG